MLRSDLMLKSLNGNASASRTGTAGGPQRILSDSDRRRRLLRRILPPVATGVCVTLLGVGLLFDSFTAWGGQCPRPPPEAMTRRANISRILNRRAMTSPFT